MRRADVRVDNVGSANPAFRKAMVDVPSDGGVDGHLLLLTGVVVADAKIKNVALRLGDQVVRRNPVDRARPDVRGGDAAVPLVSGFRLSASLIGQPEHVEGAVIVVFEDGERIVLARITVDRRPVHSFLDAPAGPSPLALVTIGRSGSTWVSGMLAGHPDVFAYKVGVLEARRLSYAAAMFRTLGRPDVYGSSLMDLPAGRAWWTRDRETRLDIVADQDVLQHLAAAEVESMAGALATGVRGFYRTVAPDASWFVEKVAPTADLPAMHELFGSFRHVVLLRDPRDVFCSMLSYLRRTGGDGFGRGSVDSDVAFAEGFGVRVARLQRSLDDAAAVVRYEDLVADQQATLSQLLDALDLDAPAGCLDAMIGAGHGGEAFRAGHITAPDVASSVGRWQSDLQGEVREALLASLGDLPQQLGYGAGATDSAAGAASEGRHASATLPSSRSDVGVPTATPDHVPWQQLPPLEVDAPTREQIAELLPLDVADEIVRLGPWHHIIELNDKGGSTGTPFGVTAGRRRDSGHDVAMTSHRGAWDAVIAPMFPDGMHDRRMLDVACNAGAYCFMASAAGATTVGFDVREHWIRQATFVQEHRTVAPTDRMTFEVHDVTDIGSMNLEPFDLTLFNGIFYHLADPIAVLRDVAALTRDLLWIDTAAAPRTVDDNGLTIKFESTAKVMSGVEHLSWLPTGPRVLAQLLAWMGFKDFRVTGDKDVPHSLRRIGVLAAREPGRLAAHPTGRPLPVQLPNNADA